MARIGIETRIVAAGHPGNRRRMRTILRILSASFILTLGGAGAGCPGCGMLPGDGGVDAGGMIVVPQDAGMIVDGGDNGPKDAGPPPTERELAERLCRLYLVGGDNAAAHTMPTPGCSAQDAIDDTERDPDLLDDPTLDCLPGQPIYESFLLATTGGRVAIDYLLLEACLEEGRAVRQTRPLWGDHAQRQSGLEAVLAGPACAGAVTSLLEEETACRQPWDCPSGLGCEADPPDGVGLRCLSPAAQGAPCEPGLRTCELGTACFDGICAFRRGLDQSCGPDQVPCEEGLVCGPAGTCAEPGEVDDLCGADVHCAAPAFCRAGQCALDTPDGEPCTPGLDRCAGLCSVCRPSAPGAETQCLDRGAAGSPCTNDDHCRAGFHCLAGTCAADGVVGTLCDDERPCLEGLTCSGSIPELPDPEPEPEPDPLGDAGVDGGLDAGPIEPDPDPDPGPDLDAGVDAGDGGFFDAGPPPEPWCQVPSPVEAACAEGDRPCLGGYCVSDERATSVGAAGICRSGAAGEPCDDDDDCAEGNLCEVAAGEDPACITAPRADAPCSADGRCADGLYCDGVRCQDLPEAGEDCAPVAVGGLRCAPSAFCDVDDDEVCLQRRAPGLACTAPEQCASGSCLITLTCASHPPDGVGTQPDVMWRVLFGVALPLGLLPLVFRSSLRRSSLGGLRRRRPSPRRRR